MTTKIPGYIEFTDSGHVCRIVHKSGMVIAELLIHDVHMMQRADHAHDRLGFKRIPRPDKPYFGEVNELESSSILAEEILSLKQMIEEFEAAEARKLDELASDAGMNSEDFQGN